MSISKVRREPLSRIEILANLAFTTAASRKAAGLLPSKEFKPIIDDTPGEVSD